MLFHLDAHERPGDPGAPLDYAALRSDGALINWVVNQLNTADSNTSGFWTLTSHR